MFLLACCVHVRGIEIAGIESVFRSTGNREKGDCMECSGCLFWAQLRLLLLLLFLLFRTRVAGISLNSLRKKK